MFDNFELDMAIREQECKEHLPRRFLKEVADPFFGGGLPSAVMAVLTVRIKMLGPLSCIVDTLEHHLFWVQTRQRHWITLQFCSAMLMSAALGVQPTWKTALEDANPAQDAMTLVDIYWPDSVNTETPMDAMASTLALRMCVNELRKT